MKENWWSSMRASAGSCRGEEQPRAPVQAWGGPAGEQLCREGPVCPGGRQVNHGTGCPGRLWSFLLWRYSRPAWTGSCAACCRWPCFSRGVGLDDPQRWWCCLVLPVLSAVCPGFGQNRVNFHRTPGRGTAGGWGLTPPGRTEPGVPYPVTSRWVPVGGAGRREGTRGLGGRSAGPVSGEQLSGLYGSLLCFLLICIVVVPVSLCLLFC